MKVLDLFSGIGGFSLGLERAGMETIAFCEFDKHARKVLTKHWPHVPIHHDVRTLDARQYRGTVSVVCGGYPCQPFSVAGKQEGAADDRHLWPSMLRIIKQARPTWVIAENVTGHIALGLDEVLSSLEAEGYAATTLVIPACALNAHHRRDRVWIIGRLGNIQPSIQSQQVLANASIDRLQRRSEESLPRVSDLQSKLTGGSEAVGIVPHPSQSGISGITHGVPGRVDRIKRLGNAVVPQIPEVIGRAIMAMEGAA